MNEVPTTNSGASKSQRRFRWIILGIVLCLPLFYFGFLIITPFKIIHTADAGFEKAQKTINAEQLRIWAVEEISKYPLTNEDMILRDRPKSEIPEGIQNLYSISPESVTVRKSESNNTLYVQIRWNDNFFHWWFAIGSTNFALSTYSDSPYKTLNWISGVYYSRERLFR